MTLVNSAITISEACGLRDRLCQGESVSHEDRALLVRLCYDYVTLADPESPDKNMPVPDGMAPVHFNFLDALRDSGCTNMFGAVPILSVAFNVDEKQAGQYCAYWMSTYAPRKSLPDA